MSLRGGMYQTVRPDAAISFSRHPELVSGSYRDYFAFGSQ
ncbi:MAG: hypothetical protein UV61_C0009G0041 [Candidatus Gottesmanbacteria bacterium GW2011_GWB1_43_11]|uniref:Uncharacterized protein n=1 Tax=Candidatus Gottesmanbacteria bacterium GW2011_GWB1_43_11 TaxID=1618446 RepID=A0A0G1CLX6_9BACT|nr:MAG: hypothetical protein UV17_C0031G0012 [Candidatus Gottesmanbacteria bacterium GW2011_GWA1_42_26]KKS81395.1 MAG: hypothetical protein UV55_C0015G0041 [Candidatus Gottesmanbacteria bacterium GW2011_GWC1_43_10]KKS86514.1 MAG: hypothetical protein UV61_C0009G0041 [Candidatus Gottesmanbacteria bacterium GW2011_GWB1_43_11]